VRAWNWQSILAGKIEEHRHRPFRWGEHDCALFAADVVRAVTGVDHASRFRGLYDSPSQARRILERYGGLRALVSSILGREINTRFAQRGDVVLIKNKDRELLGVCLGARCACPGDEGLVFFKMKDVLAAWRVE